MKVQITRNDKECLVAIEGRVDTVTAPLLDKEVAPLYNEAGITLIFDCAALEYISSSGLRVILMTHKQVSARGGKFIMRNMIKEVSTVFEMTGFARILNIE